MGGQGAERTLLPVMGATGGCLEEGEGAEEAMLKVVVLIAGVRTPSNKSFIATYRS